MSQMHWPLDGHLITVSIPIYHELDRLLREAITAKADLDAVLARRTPPPIKSRFTDDYLTGFNHGIHWSATQANKVARFITSREENDAEMLRDFSRKLHRMRAQLISHTPANVHVDAISPEASQLISLVK